MAGIETGINLLEQIFFFTSFVDQFWVSQLVIIVATMALITRKVGNWKSLALPVMVGWQGFGMYLPWVFYVAGAIVFVVDILSMKAVEGALGAVANTASFISDRVRNRGKYKELKALKKDTKKMDIKDEIKRLQERKDPLLAQDREIFKGFERRAREEAIKEKYFPKFYEEDLLKKKKLSKPKKEFTE